MSAQRPRARAASSKPAGRLAQGFPRYGAPRFRAFRTGYPTCVSGGEPEQKMGELPGMVIPEMRVPDFPKPEEQAPWTEA